MREYAARTGGVEPQVATSRRRIGGRSMLRRWVALHVAVAVTALAAWACEGVGRWSLAPPSAEPGPQKFIGCVGQTGNPDVFVVAVAMARKAHAGAPPGTVVPQKSQLPPGSPPPERPRVATVGPPGDGADPTTRIDSYLLVGNGGLDLRKHVGHTINIVGDVQEIPESTRVVAKTEGALRELHVKSARHVADNCTAD